MDRLRLISAYVLLASWLVLVFYQAFVDRTYVIPGPFHMFVGAVVTVLFGLPYVLKNGHNGKGGDR